MTPIEKNIRVVDEQGNELKATYPKRAKGLIKNGRARIIDENTICLACPPNIMEENIMSDNQNQLTIEKKTNESVNKQSVQTPRISYSLEYALEQLEKVRAESAAFTEKIFEMINNNKSLGPEDIGAASNAEALKVFAVEHEVSIRKQIDFYQNMVTELKPLSPNE